MDYDKFGMHKIQILAKFVILEFKTLVSLIVISKLDRKLEK